MTDDILGHDFIQPRHRNPIAGAAAFALAMGLRANVVRVALAAFARRRAGGHRHRPLARLMLKQGRQKGITGDDPGRRDLRIACVQDLLDELETVRVDDRGNNDLDMLGRVARSLCSGVALVVLESPAVCPVDQDRMDRPDTEPTTAPRAIASRVEPLADRLDAESVAGLVAVEVQGIDLLDRLSLYRIDLETLFDPGALSLDLSGTVPERGVPPFQ